MRIALAIGGGVGCGALPVLIAAFRRRGWTVIPAALPAIGAPCLASALLRDLCGVESLSTAEWPAADVTVVAPCDSQLLAALWAEGPHPEALRLPSPVVVVPVAATPEPPTAERSAVTTGGRRGWRFVPPTEPLLGGGVADLFMASPAAVCETAAAGVAVQDLAGTTVLVTAGPTCEDLDPVRFLSNRSSGLMGVALALAAWRRGAAVTLVHGPVQVQIPRLPGLLAVPVRSACEMHAAVMAVAGAQTVAILCAAVADFRPAGYAERKIKKNAGQGLVLELLPTPDILAALGALPRRPFLVGFAAETHDLNMHATDKLRRKNCDVLCANDVSEPGSGFAVTTNRITLFARDGSITPLPLLSKDSAADGVLDRVVADLRQPRFSP